MSTPATLLERQTDFTRQVILDAAVDTLERSTVTDLTVRAVAKHANISERTVFRYFPTREDFLDAVATEVRTRLDLPPPPRSVDDLYALPRALYSSLDAKARLTRVSLHTELSDRIRGWQAKERWSAVRKVIDALTPRRSEQERKLAAANIYYYVTASTWQYYRFYLGFSLEDSVAAAEAAIRDTLTGLGRAAPRR